MLIEASASGRPWATAGYQASHHQSHALAPMSALVLVFGWVIQGLAGNTPTCVVLRGKVWVRYNHITAFGRSIGLQQQSGIPLIVASVATVVGRALLSCGDHHCFPPECSSTPPQPTEPDCGPSLP